MKELERRLTELERIFIRDSIRPRVPSPRTVIAISSELRELHAKLMSNQPLESVVIGPDIGEDEHDFLIGPKNIPIGKKSDAGMLLGYFLEHKGELITYETLEKNLNIPRYSLYAPLAQLKRTINLSSRYYTLGNARGTYWLVGPKNTKPKIKKDRDFGYAFVAGSIIYLSPKDLNLRFKLDSVIGQVFLFLLENERKWVSRHEIDQYLASKELRELGFYNDIGILKDRLLRDRYYRIEERQDRYKQYRLLPRIQPKTL